MLEFKHDNGDENWHRWSWVYLHGKAEEMNMQAFNDGGQAPDICMANEPIDNYIPGYKNNGRFDKTIKMAIQCLVDGEPAICVVSTNRHGMFGGRISLISDFDAMRHIYAPDDWR